MTDKPRILITRPERQAAETAEAIAQAYPDRFDVTVSPLLAITEEPADPDFDNLQGVLFTSRNAVEVAAHLWSLQHLPALCVGDATARAAEAAGVTAFSAEGDASTLSTLAVQAYLPEAGDYIHLRGAESAGDIAGALAAEGIGLREAIIYDQRPVDLSEDTLDLLAADAISAVMLFSPRTASLFEQAVAELPLPVSTTAICISPAVAESLSDETVTAKSVAVRPDLTAMLATLSAL